jgi:hypothetical protein
MLCLTKTFAPELGIDGVTVKHLAGRRRFRSGSARVFGDRLK